ncbi:hypothetical protein LOTGIDRAFT_158508 [Lottia gigantea]|uniref:Uncharacterized protein n=1 Tax=Lottia gigantea TaxID=225164 RepID=V4AQC7_LOTGI|nr:hypothetical protein LOTGIDRAFT_158508 [Lottia gigantea]ESO99422.1 hypothetical protein LOTGIDRAFT_158508 [Lottia gigantea]
MATFRGREVLRAKYDSPIAKKLRRRHPYQVARKEACQVYDKIFGLIYGHCVGDAVGLLTENMSKEQAKKTYGSVASKLELVHKKLIDDAHRRKWKVNDWTEESDHMIILIQSLVQNCGDIVPDDIAKRLMDWSEHGFLELGDDIGYGLCHVNKNVINHPQFSEEPLKAAEIIWRKSEHTCVTNSALTRCCVMGIHHYNALGKVIKYTMETCSITHAHPKCIASCVAVTTTIAVLLQNDEKYQTKKGELDIDSIIENSYQYASRCMTNCSYQEIKELRQYMKATSLKELKLTEAGLANHTYKAMGAGFWALKQRNFRQAITDIVMEGGDADANACVAGAMLGCKLGVKENPQSWITALEHRLWLDQIIDRFQWFQSLSSNDINDKSLNATQKSLVQKSIVYERKKALRAHL